jgi:hypothetical protein
MRLRIEKFIVAEEILEHNRDVLAKIGKTIN